MSVLRYGFRILGPCSGERRLIEFAKAFAAYAECNQRAEVQRESYLSAFTFGEEFRKHLTCTGSTRGYDGPCWTPWVWWDIDAAEDLEGAQEGTTRLCGALSERYGIQPDCLLIFFSGSKGFHVGLPTSLWEPEPSETFNRTARRFCENTAESALFGIDAGIYDKVRAFRAPNSRHPKTGLHKRRLSLQQLQHMETAAIADLATEPVPFEIPDPTQRSETAAADWRAAAEQAHRETEVAAQLRAARHGTPTLNRLTLEFIRHGAALGGAADDCESGNGRHRRLFSAAANLAEFRCPPALAHALLTEAGLDSGLPPSEVRRQIKCGLAREDDGT